jgi:hypothetical protein
VIGGGKVALKNDIGVRIAEWRRGRWWRENPALRRAATMAQLIGKSGETADFEQRRSDRG